MRFSSIRLVVLSCLMLLALPVAAEAATFTVTKTTDTVPATGTCTLASCSLRQAIEAANGSSGNLVVVPAGTYPLSEGELTVSKPMTIEGAGSAVTAIDAGGKSRVLQVTAAANPATVSGLTIRNGKVAGSNVVLGQGAGIQNAGSLTLRNDVISGNTVLPSGPTGAIENGGGIFNSGDLSVFGSVIADNLATTLPLGGGIASGGGIYSQGALRMTDSSVLRNTASSSAIPNGAGVYVIGSVANGGIAELTRVRFEGNKVIDPAAGGIAAGAGIWTFRTNLVVRESTFSSNSALGGAVAEGSAISTNREGNTTIERSLITGGLAEGGTYGEGALSLIGEPADTVRVVNSTITANTVSGKTSGLGGGVRSGGELKVEILSSTLSGNTAAGPGANKGGNVYAGEGKGATVLRDTIVSAGIAAAGAENCFGPVSSAGHNLDSRNQCKFSAAGDKVNADPLLGPLADNGGPTLTMALLSGSPAIDAGLDCPAVDQRGVARPQGSGCDIGAFELVPPPLQVTLVPTPPHPAEIKLLAKKVRVNPKTGGGNFKASCASEGGDRCVVTLTLRVKVHTHHGAAASARKRRSVVGSVSGTIAGGAVGRLRLKLNAHGRALLQARPKGFAVTATGGSLNASGAAVAVRHGLRIVPRSSVHH